MTVECLHPSGPTNKWVSPKLLWHTCRASVAPVENGWCSRMFIHRTKIHSLWHIHLYSQVGIPSGDSLPGCWAKIGSSHSSYQRSVSWWCQGLNLGPSACKLGALPLHVCHSSLETLTPQHFQVLFSILVLWNPCTYDPLILMAVHTWFIQNFGNIYGLSLQNCNETVRQFHNSMYNLNIMVTQNITLHKILHVLESLFCLRPV